MWTWYVSFVSKNYGMLMMLIYFYSLATKSLNVFLESMPREVECWLFLKNDQKYKIFQEYSIFIEKLYEIEITINNKKFSITSHYRPNSLQTLHSWNSFLNFWNFLLTQSQHYPPFTLNQFSSVILIWMSSNTMHVAKPLCTLIQFLPIDSSKL